MGKEFDKLQDFLKEEFKEHKKASDISKALKWFGAGESDWDSIQEKAEYTALTKELQDEENNEMMKWKQRPQLHLLVGYEQAIQRYRTCDHVKIVKHELRSDHNNEFTAELMKEGYKVQ